MPSFFEKLANGGNNIISDPSKWIDPGYWITGQATGSRKGPVNPYGPTDFSKLLNFDPKNPYRSYFTGTGKPSTPTDSTLPGFTGGGGGTGLGPPAPGAPINPGWMTDRGKTYGDFYQAPSEISENYFQDLIKNIQAPSSVDDVKRET